MTEKRLGLHNVVAMFADPGRARKALQALQAEGIGPPETSLLAPEAQMPPGTTRPRQSNRTTLRGIGRSLLVGLTIGTVAGALLGALIGAVIGLLPMVSSSPLEVGLSAAVAGAVMGHVSGALVGLETGGRKAAMWEQSLHPLVPRMHRGAALVGVHTDDSDRAERAVALLSALEADEIQRYRADETYDPPGMRAAMVGETVPSDSPAAPGGTVSDAMDDLDR